MTLAEIEVFEVPGTVVNESGDILRQAGTEGYELFVLWTGVVTTARFQVEHIYVPRQQTFKGEGGLQVRVDGDELHKLNRWLYDNHQVLGIQVHTHPGEAFHSETDDLYPIVTTLGGLSIVVPRFCHDGVLTDGTAIYRLSTSGWMPVDTGIDLLLVQGDGTR